MEKLTVRRLSCDACKAADIPGVMERNGVVYNRISYVNWGEAYPYLPSVEFAIAHTSDRLLLHYRVEEQSVRAVARHDNENIWEDSCVEFFISPVEDGTYYNVECNCAGHLLVGGGRVNPDRVRSELSVMGAIDRWASLGSTPFDTIEGKTHWEVALVIPVSTFFMHDVARLDGRVMRANFYKCGDKLPVPHFVSWAPIVTDRPNFHCPEFFGEVVME